MLFIDGSADSPMFSMETGGKTSGQLYSYLAFTVFALAYFWYYLPQGFSILDDAYLAALGQRIVNGQSLYSDFYYLRTPLSPLIQSFWIQALGAKYTVLVSRVVWAIQLYTTIVTFSFVYRKWLSATALAVTLCATLVYSSLLFAFPWYTYDGMFFTALFAVFAYRRRFLLAGACAGLAFLCKQGFVALLPLYLLYDFLEVKRTKEPVAHWFAHVGGAIGGAAIVIALTVSVLDASLAEIWRNVFVLPRSINGLPLSFILYQDFPRAFGAVWPLALTLAVILVIPLKAYVKSALVIVWLVLAWPSFSKTANVLPFTITIASFALCGWLCLLALRYMRESRENVAKTMYRQIARVSALGLIGLYVAGFNYGGLIFSYIGGVLSLPVLIVCSAGWAWRTDARAERRQALSGSASPWFPSVLATVILASAIFAHHRFPYMSVPRHELQTPFTSQALAGIHANPGLVTEIDSLVSLVQTLTEPEDSVLAFPLPASLNFITGRRAWGAVQWYYKREFNITMAQESSDLFFTSPPALVVLTSPQRIPDMPQFDTLYNTIIDNCRTVDSVGPFHILVPDCAGGNEATDER